MEGFEGCGVGGVTGQAESADGFREEGAGEEFVCAGVSDLSEGGGDEAGG